ncbi:MAG: DoxX family membrane protein [Crocinitomicaceae bacterium]|nr:DoxX family membrane protein [Crocinitomicaceae bacterium]
MNEMRLRNQKIDVRGRSAILNIAAILLNITGVVLTVIGFHESTAEGTDTILQVSGLLLVAASIFVLIMLKGMLMFSYVSRAFVGGLFIVSGLVKANDPWGFAFKLEEYFSPTGLAADFPFFGWFEPYIIELSVLICVVEIVLGVAVILGGKIKLATWSLLGMMIFFAWLTYYTASCNEKQTLAMEMGMEFNRDCVTDCGCFGDALKGSVGRSLSPWESFWKDLVLFYFTLVLMFSIGKIKLNTVKENWVMVPASMIVVIFFSWVFGWMLPIFFALIALLGSFVIGNINIGKMAKPWKMALFVTLLSFLFSLYTSFYLPVKDYRPYAIGNNLIEKMNDGVPQVSEFVLIYKNKKTGKEEEFALDQYAIYGDTSTYQYVDRKETIIVPGVDASITDFQASINFDALSEDEKKIAYIDSLIQADFDFFYEEKMVVSSTYGADTIAAIDYDTLYYPDSMYTAGEPFVALADPYSPWVLDITPYLLTADNIFLMTIRDIENMNEGAIADFKAVAEGAKANGIPFFVLSPATNEQIELFKSKFDFDVTFLGFDGTEVKIIVRSNPGLVLLQNGTVIDKWPSRSIPDFDSIFEDYIKAE